MRSFFEMGGYGLYVWLAYGAAAAILVANVVWVFREKHKTRKLLQRTIEKQI